MDKIFICFILGFFENESDNSISKSTNNLFFALKLQSY
jgi:hypothetical protein